MCSISLGFCAALYCEQSKQNWACCSKQILQNFTNLASICAFHRFCTKLLQWNNCHINCKFYGSQQFLRSFSIAMPQQLFAAPDRNESRVNLISEYPSAYSWIFGERKVSSTPSLVRIIACSNQYASADADNVTLAHRSMRGWFYFLLTIPR